MSRRPSIEIIVCKERGRLVPASADDAEILAGQPEGAEFDLHPRARRSLPQNKLYWATLMRIREATFLGDRYPTSAKLHEALLIDLGFVTVTYTLDGTPRVTRDSTAFDAMGPDDFNAYLQRALARLAEVTGIDPAAAHSETRRAAA